MDYGCVRCGKRYRYQRAFERHRTVCYATGQRTVLEDTVRMVVREELSELRSMIKEILKKRGPYREKTPSTKPIDRSLFGFSQAEFVSGIEKARARYRQHGFKLEGAINLIVATVDELNGGSHLLRRRANSLVDADGEALFFDVNEKSRWYYNVPRTRLFKRLESSEFLPEDVKATGWKYLVASLRRPAIRGCESHSLKIDLINALCNYSAPTDSDEQEFDSYVMAEGSEFWETVQSGEDLWYEYGIYLNDSKKWAAVLAGHFEKHPTYAKSYMNLKNSHQKQKNGSVRKTNRTPAVCTTA